MKKIKPTEIILQKLEPGSHYVMLYDPSLVRMKDLRNLKAPDETIVSLVAVGNVNKAVKFIKIPEELNTRKKDS